MATRKAYDIVVVGAGPVGLLFAYRCARHAGGAMNIRVLDARRPRRWRADDVDARVYALSRESQRLFADLWPAMVARRVSPYRRMRVFEGERFDGHAAVDFDAADIGEPDLGHIVEDSLIRSVLLEGVQREGVRVQFGSGIERLDTDGGRRRLRCGDGSVLHADLVVGADGVRSRIREAAGIGIVHRDYRQRAIVAHVTTEQAHRETAWQRFLPDGPLAFLPLADGRSSIVWTHARADAERLLALPESEFLDALRIASAGLLGRLGPSSKRLAFPLVLQHAVRYSRLGVALIGDSAHVVHPLAGQGMNLGLRDAAVLADTVTAAVAAGQHPGDELVLGRYARIQKGHNLAMQLAFDGINEIYGRRMPGFMAPLRGLGMAAVDRAQPAKRFLMRRALGLDRATFKSGGDERT
jgi:2-octaprenylphenol hydroxylase